MSGLRRQDCDQTIDDGRFPLGHGVETEACDCGSGADNLK
jgi:hypothetical protein